MITPRATLERVMKLQEAYAELKTDMLEEVSQVDTRITNPATDAKEYLQPMKKVIKKRQDRKVPLEAPITYVLLTLRSLISRGIKVGSIAAIRKPNERNGRTLPLQSTSRIWHEQKRFVYMFSDRHGPLGTGNAALLASISVWRYHTDKNQEYTIADDKLKACLPPIITAAYSILPHLLAAQIMIQNTLIGQYYTLLHTYCQEEGFPSPPPPMIEVIAAWENDFQPAQHDIETGIACVAGGKAVRQPMKLEDRQPSGTLTGLNIRNGFAHRKANTQSSNGLRPSVSPSRSERSEPPSPNHDNRSSPNPDTRPRISSVPSQSSLALAIPNYSHSTTTSPSFSELYTPQLHAPAGPRGDYFSRDRNATSSSAMASAAAMKKEPPPPPPKRVPSSQGSWVTALYDFKGQGKGDLVFQEGDRIKVVKKTESTDDWWEGELKGVQGSFPANYCQTV